MRRSESDRQQKNRQPSTELLPRGPSGEEGSGEHYSWYRSELTREKRNAHHLVPCDGAAKDNGARRGCMALALIAMTIVLVGTGCSKKEDNKPPPPSIKVGVISVDKGDVRHWLRASGPLKFIATTTVSSEVSAQVKSIEVTDGQAVHEGQLLLRFDETKIKETSIQAASNLQKNEANLTYSKADWEKNKKLFERRAISETVYEQKLSAYQQLAAQVEADRSTLAKALDDLKKTRVKAPISGRISRRYVERGDWVPESGKLFQISDVSKVYLEAHLSDKDVARLNIRKVLTKGVEAELTVDSYPGKVFRGMLTYLDPVADATNLFEIRIYVDNPDMELLQGMFARGRVVVGNTKDVVRVPVAALMDQVRAHDSNTVFTVEKDRKARLKRIKIGTTNRNYAQVLAGLNAGDMVVVRGKEVLGDGQPLEPTEMPKP